MILVTGALGFIGAHTVRALTALGQRCPALTRRPAPFADLLRRCAVIISLRAAPCRDESRDRASANRSPESFINGPVFTLKGLPLAR